MDVNELLDEVKAKLGVKSDYRLGKLLEITDQDLAGYRSGRQIPDAYACFRFAEVLGKAPTVIIAQIQSEKAKHEHKRLYFKRFFSIAALWITFGVALVIFNGFSNIAYAAGNQASSHNPSLCAIILRCLRWLKVLKNERYFTCNWHVKYQTA